MCQALIHWQSKAETRKIPIHFDLCVSTLCAYICNVWESLSRQKFAETVTHLHAYSSVPLCLVECHCKAWSGGRY